MVCPQPAGREGQVAQAEGGTGGVGGAHRALRAAGRRARVHSTGGGVVKYSKNKKEAVRFLEFLTSEKAQSLYGSINFEYPVRIGMTQPAELISWGIFQEDQLSIGRIAELAPRAQRIIDRVGW